eukprot:5832685-Pleurochrysis_carterae.AAC.1
MSVAVRIPTKTPPLPPPPPPPWCLRPSAPAASVTSSASVRCVSMSCAACATPDERQKTETSIPRKIRTKRGQRPTHATCDTFAASHSLLRPPRASPRANLSNVPSWAEFRSHTAPNSRRCAWKQGSEKLLNVHLQQHKKAKVAQTSSTKLKWRKRKARAHNTLCHTSNELAEAWNRRPAQ